MATYDDIFGDGNPYLNQETTPEITITPEEKEQNYFVETAKNVPSSFMNLVNAIAEPFKDPVKFAKSMAQLGDSIFGIMGITDGDPAQAKAVGQYFADRYGSLEGFKEAFKTDPVGIVSDIAVVATGGAFGVAKGSQLVVNATNVANNVAKASKASQGTALVQAVNKNAQKVASGATVAGNVASKIDPIMGTVAITQLPAVKNVLAMGAVGAGKLVTAPLAVTTGKSSDAIGGAFDAGLSGGKKAEAFKSQFLGKGSPDDIVNKAIEGLLESKNNMSKVYNNGMTGLAMSQKIVPDFATKLRKIRQNYLDKHMKFQFDKGGKVLKLPKGAEPFFKEIDDIIETAIKDTKNYTYGALDDVKKAIDKATPNAFNATNKNATDALTIRNEVKDLIVKEIPEYADVMKAYEDANFAKTQIEKQLSLGTNIKEIANIDTTYRKLLSAMNDNVNANFGSRLNAVNKIDPTGELSAGLSGVQMSQLAPSNIVSRGGGLAFGTGAYYNPMLALGLPAFSPAVVGGLAYGAGSGARLAGKALPFANPVGFAQRTLADPTFSANPMENILTYGLNQTYGKNSPLRPAINYLQNVGKGLLGD